MSTSHIARRTSHVTLSRLVLLLALAGGAAAGQVFHSGVEVVTVTVTVTDPDGRLVPGLTKHDFVVLEDGVSQPLATFTGERLPVSLGILLDVSDSMFGRRIADARQALERFLVDLLEAEDEAFLMTFNHGQEIVAPWTSNPRRLSGRLDAARPFGGTALYDALIAASPEYKGRTHQRAALLVISDGADTASDASLIETAAVLRRADPFVYAIAIDSSSRVPINSRVNPEAVAKLRLKPPSEASVSVSADLRY